METLSDAVQRSLAITNVENVVFMQHPPSADITASMQTYHTIKVGGGARLPPERAGRLLDACRQRQHRLQLPDPQPAKPLPGHLAAPCADRAADGAPGGRAGPAGGAAGRAWHPAGTVLPRPPALQRRAGWVPAAALGLSWAALAGSGARWPPADQLGQGQGLLC